MTTTNTLKTLYLTCYSDAKRKSIWTVITSNKRSKVEGCNDFYKMKTIVLLMRRHNSEKAICLYTLAYIDTKELAFEKEEIVLQSDCNWLVCSRKYTRKVYT